MVLTSKGESVITQIHVIHGQQVGLSAITLKDVKIESKFVIKF